MRKRIEIILTGLLMMAALAACAKLAPGSETARSSASTDKIVRFIKERFGMSAGATMTAGPLSESVSPQFDQVTLTIGDGNPQHDKKQTVYVSKDGHCLVVGNIFQLANADSQNEILQHFFETFKVKPSGAIAVSKPEKSSFPNLDVAKVSYTGDSRDIYLTPDARTLILGIVFRLSDHPEQDVMRSISTVDQPSIGPAYAPVTIVEYADLQCPSCAKMDEFLEHDLVPKYGNKVRVVFKELPLKVHAWSKEGAIANECAYQIDPKTFVPYRGLIFKHQDDIDAVQSDPSKVRDLLLKYGEQAGLSRTKLSACVDSRATAARVGLDYKEAVALSIMYTPTFFINGRPKFGFISPQDFYKAVDQALQEAKSTPPRSPTATTR